MRIVVCTDDYPEQIGGVNTFVKGLASAFQSMGHEFIIIHPESFEARSFHLFSYKCVFPSFKEIAKLLPQSFDAIHLFMTGRFLTFQMRRFCLFHKIPFTTTYGNNLCEFANMYFPLSNKIFFYFMHWFHRPAESVFVHSHTLRDKLHSWGLKRTSIWVPGVNPKIFHPKQKPKTDERILLYVGRVVRQKNIEAFLRSNVRGKKMIIGDGPSRAKLEHLYPDATFLGFLEGEELAKAYGKADVFVFPSKTDTFGLVMIEALACGVPVAAFPVMGPIDIITDPRLGCLSENLDEAIEIAFARGDREFCSAYGHSFSWEKSAKQFLENQSIWAVQ